jgi:hypothetical protein
MKLKVGQRWLRTHKFHNYFMIIEITEVKEVSSSWGKIIQISPDEFSSKKEYDGYHLNNELGFEFANWGNVEYSYLEGQDKSNGD